MDESVPGGLNPADSSRSESSTLPSSGAVRALGLPQEFSPPRIPDHELIRRIGAGAYGEVWLARNVTGSFRAVKIVHRSSFESDRPYQREFEGIKRFEPVSHARESQVDIFHVGISPDAGCFYYIMDLADDANADCGTRSAECPEGPSHEPPPHPSFGHLLPRSERGRGKGEGAQSGSGFQCANPSGNSHPQPLSHRMGEGGRRPGDGNPQSYAPRTLKHDLKTRGALPFDECVCLALALTQALEHLHAHGLVHRDIKPSNIIFVNGVPKLADIGLVTSVDATRSFVGTEGYVAPEGPGSPQADLFSLGKALYEMATGGDRESFPEIPVAWRERPDYPQLLELNEIVLKACDNAPPAALPDRAGDARRTGIQGTAQESRPRRMAQVRVVSSSPKSHSHRDS